MVSLSLSHVLSKLWAVLSFYTQLRYEHLVSRIIPGSLGRLEHIPVFLQLAPIIGHRSDFDTDLKVPLTKIITVTITVN